MHTESIAVLAPVNHLPAEGAEPPAASSATTDTGPRPLLDFYAATVGDGGLYFEVSPAGIVARDDLAPVLQFLEVRKNGGAVPILDLAGSFSSLDLPVGDELPLDGSAAPDDFLRAFLDRLNRSLPLAVRGFRGSPIPLVRWHPLEDGPGVAVQCLGVWLADDASLRSFSGNGGNSGGASTGVIFENPEVEGRGLREGLTALAIAGIFLASVPAAEAGLFSRRAKASQAESPTRGPKLRAEVDRKILERATSGNTHVLIDVSKQRAYFLVNGQVAIDTPVSTARTGKHTPRGEFRITQKVRSGKTSTIYGCDLPYWMRLDESAIGLHVGDLPGYPASAGCVRLPSNIAPLIFDNASSGTVVKIVDSVDLDGYAKAF